MDSVIGNWLGNAILQRFFVDTPAWLALHLADPGVLGSPSTELSGGEYIRQTFPSSVPSNKTITNAVPVVFDNLPLTTIYYVALWSHRTGGNFFTSVKLATPMVVPSSARLVVAAQSIALTL